jgi:uncharacterized protein
VLNFRLAPQVLIHPGESMKKMFHAILFAMLLAPVFASAAPASEAAIRQLLTVTKSRELVDGMHTQFNTMMSEAIRQSLQGKTPTPRQQQAIKNATDKMVALLRDELAWEKMIPIYLRLYRESFTEEEIKGMLTFYRTPAGQAVVRKMPLLVERSLIEMQQMIAVTIPRMKQIEEEFLVEMDAAANSPNPAPAAQ